MQHFIPVTIGLKVDELYVHPKNEHLDPKNEAKCLNVTFRLPVIRSAAPVTFCLWVTSCLMYFMSHFPINCDISSLSGMCSLCDILS
jgi:hypothetical protein